jgi:hypothetical protein
MCARGPRAVTRRSAWSGAGRAAFSLDVVGSALYLAGGYSNAKLYAADMWVLRMPARAAEARAPHGPRACQLCMSEHGEHGHGLMVTTTGCSKSAWVPRRLQGSRLARFTYFICLKQRRATGLSVGRRPWTRHRRWATRPRRR